jgi:hypothetical protein
MATLRSVQAGTASVVASLLLVGCPLDERTLAPYPVDIIDPGLGGQAGDGFGEPLPEGGEGGESEPASGGSGGTAGSAGKGGAAGRAGGGSGGTGGDENTGGTPACPDLDQDGEPDCDQTLVTNGRFDEDSSNWTAQDSVERVWVPLDAEGRADSGSLKVANLTQDENDQIVMAGAYQCIPINNGQPTTYTFLGQVYIEPGQGQGSAGVSLLFFSLPGCLGTAIVNKQNMRAETGSWQIAVAEATTTYETKSVAVRLVSVKPARAERFEARFDNILFNSD